MSAEAEAYTWTSSPYSGAAFTIHLALADVVNDLHGNEVWMSQGGLARKARTTRMTVSRTIPRMIGDGFLQRLSPDDQTGAPVRYRFLMPDRPATWRYTPPVTPRHTTRNTTLQEGVTPRGTELELNSRELKTSSEGDYLCLLLADLVESNGSKRPNITDRWRTEAEKLLRLDERPVVEAEHLIRWCQADPFWRSNILSMPTFRAKYDQLRLRSQNGNAGKPGIVDRLLAKEGLTRGEP